MLSYTFLLVPLLIVAILGLAFYNRDLREQTRTLTHVNLDKSAEEFRRIVHADDHYDSSIPIVPHELSQS